MYDRQDIRPALNYRSEKKPIDKKAKNSPKLTDHTPSHQRTMGWEDNLPAKTSFMSDPTSGYVAGMHSVIEKNAESSTWNIFSGFKKAAENAI